MHPVRSRRRRTFLRPRLQLRISQPRHHIEAFLQSGTRRQRHHRRVAYERLLESNGCFHRVCQDCRVHKVDVNLNRISSFHSMIKDFYRGYRGVATKYINRYAAVFSFIWKFRKLKDNDLHGKIKAMADKSGFAIRTGVVQTYRLFTPQDIEWVVAS